MKRFLLALILIFTVCHSLKSQLTSSGWVSTISGSGFDNIADVETDLEGSVYAIGVFSGTADFDGSAGVNNITSKGERDVFITKHSSAGDLMWVKSFGGSMDDIGFSLAINNANEVYVVGTFEGEADFGATSGELVLSSAGQQDFFITKLAEDGALLWAKKIGGSSVDEANDIAIDNSNNLYVVGRFVSTVDFDPGAGTNNLSAGSTPDAFILKLDGDGEFLWAHDLGSGGNEESEAVVVDSENNVIVAGSFSGTTDFDPGPGEEEIYGDGAGDPFYLKLNPEGDFIWVTTFTSDGYVFSADLDIDSDDNIVAHGFFSKDMNFNPNKGGDVIQSIGAEDSYTAKINANGDLVWANILGGTSIDFGYGVAVDAIGDVYVTGLFYDSPDFDPSNGEFFLTSAGIEDTYIVKYDSAGNFVWAKQTGGSSSDAGYGIDIGPTGDILIVGNYWGTSDLDPEPDASLNIASQGGSDLFILKIVQFVSSIKNEKDILVDFIISPNPTADFIKIEGEYEYPIEVLILDAFGTKLTNKIVLHSNEEKIYLDRLTPGIYNVVIKSNKNIGLKKFVKM